MDASHVYVRAWALGCFRSHISTRTFRRALTASLNSCAIDKECPFSGVTKSGRVWRKVPESDARNVHHSVDARKHEERSPRVNKPNQTSTDLIQTISALVLVLLAFIYRGVGGGVGGGGSCTFW